MPSEPLPASTTIESVVEELHRRGVERGEREYERLVDEARQQAAAIINGAETRKAALIELGQREAERIAEAAQAQADQLLQSFLASLPEMFSRRASQLLEALLDQSFAEDSGIDTVSQFVDAQGADAAQRLRRYLDQAEPKSFIEALLMISMLQFGGSNGFCHFELDARLKSRLAKLLADPALDPSLQFEFRDGIRGFSVKADDGREIEVSPESCKHMAEAWANEEFRRVFNRLLADQHG